MGLGVTFFGASGTKRAGSEGSNSGSFLPRASTWKLQTTWKLQPVDETESLPAADSKRALTHFTGHGEPVGVLGRCLVDALLPAFLGRGQESHAIGDTRRFAARIPGSSRLRCVVVRLGGFMDPSAPLAVAVLLERRQPVNHSHSLASIK